MYVRFLAARTLAGVVWSDHSLLTDAVVRLGDDGRPLVEVAVRSDIHSLRVNALAFVDSPAPPALVLGVGGLPLTSTEEVATSLIDYQFVDPIFHYDMGVLAHRAGAPPE